MTTILIADDAAFMRMRCGRMLADNGFTVLEAENGRDAVEKFRAHRPDAVLLDITMPELDGLGALRAIRDRRGRRVSVEQAEWLLQHAGLVGATPKPKSKEAEPRPPKPKPAGRKPARSIGLSRRNSRS